MYLLVFVRFFGCINDITQQDIKLQHIREKKHTFLPAIKGIM